MVMLRMGNFTILREQIAEDVATTRKDVAIANEGDQEVSREIDCEFTETKKCLNL